MNKNPARYLSLGCGFIFLASLQSGLASPELKDDIGYTQLNNLLGGSTPDGSGVVISQIESPDGGGNWMPDASNNQLINKTITKLSSATSPGLSNHATGMAYRFSGSYSSVSSGVNEIGVYYADGWLQGDFLNLTSNRQPQVQTGRIANHSWIGSAGSYNRKALSRVDWLIETDEFLQIVGTNNSPTGANQALLCSAYNVISVGKTVGGSIGTVSVDSVYTPNRTAPHVVAPETTTSAATAIVTSVTALLIDAAHNNAALSQGSKQNRGNDTLYHAEYASVLKALIMSGADRSTSNTSTAANITDYRAIAANQSANGLDKRYGAGQVNVLNSYTILQAGEQQSQQDGNAGNIDLNGFDYDESFGGSSGSNSTADYPLTAIATTSEIKIALVWNIDINGGSTNFFNEAATLYNLDLTLVNETTGTSVAVSASTIDNTENIVHTLIPGHQYTIKVDRVGSNFNWSYALAWHVTAVPDFDGDGIPDSSDPDIDNDGIDNEWETLYGLDPYNVTDANLDTDGDGRNNLTEFLDGGDPTTQDTGDASGDGLVQLNDLLLLQQHLLEIQSLDASAISRSDQNSNGSVELSDMLALLKVLAGN